MTKSSYKSDQMGNMTDAPQQVCQNRSAAVAFRSKIAAEQGDGLDRSDERLLACLSDLVRRHIAKGAAQQLSVGYQTVRRALETDEVKGVLRKELERYLLADADFRQPPWWVQMDELYRRIDGRERQLQQVAERVEETRQAMLAAGTRRDGAQQELAKRLGRLERQAWELACLRDGVYSLHQLPV